jgi:hypothetical protein
MSKLTLIAIFLFLPAILLMHGEVESGTGLRPSGQDSLKPAGVTSQEPAKTPAYLDNLFDTIEAAILAGDVKKLAPYFGKQVNLSLQSGPSGYFSGNQSYYILQNYFSSRKILSFKFTSRKLDDTYPYATGGGTSRAKGVNEILQFYVALAEVDGRWVISQFNVY